MNKPETDFGAFASACASTDPGQGVQGLIAALDRMLPELHFEQVLTRGGWYRPGGVLDGEGTRLAEHIRPWLEEQVGDDLEAFLAEYQDRGLVATRLQGKTHYLTASTGDAPEDFVQLEVEELQEITDRELLPADWHPDDIEDLVDPLDRQPLPGMSVGEPRLVFRRVQAVPELLDAAGERLAALKRFMYDWSASSAASAGPFHRHWALSLRETVRSDGELRVTAKPVAAHMVSEPDLAPYQGQRGESLVDAIRRYDQAAGYPFAWFFGMLTSTHVPFEIGEAVLADLAADYAYLPPRDALVLSAWSNKRYAV